MKRTTSIILSSGILLSSLFFNAYSTEAKTTLENASTEKVLYEKSEETDLSKAIEEEYKTIKIENELLNEPDVNVEAIIENSDNENMSIDIEEYGTQLLKVTKNEDGNLRADYVTVAEATFDEELIDSLNDNGELLNNGSISILAEPIGSKTEEAWVSGIHGFVKVYYHKDYKDNMAVSYDMNYIQVWWTTDGSGGIVSDRSVTMQQSGKSHWGNKAFDHTKTVTPVKNSMTQYDVPDSWEPIWEGLVMARSSAKVKNITTGQTYTLKVQMRII